MKLFILELTETVMKYKKVILNEITTKRKRGDKISKELVTFWFCRKTRCEDVFNIITVLKWWKKQIKELKMFIKTFLVIYYMRDIRKVKIQ